MNDRGPLSLWQMLGVIFTDSVIPLVIIICFLTVLVTLWRARRTRDVKDSRYFLNAIGFFVFSLALPFLTFPIQLTLDLTGSRAFGDFRLVMSTAAIVGGTYLLVKGVRTLGAKEHAG